MAATHSGYYDRIVDLADEARRARASFEADGIESDAADERALAYCREGVGPVVAVYVEARTADYDVEFSQRELDLLHGALNDWLALYARCYGVEMEPEFTVRQAAEVLIETHNVRDVALLLTRVPARTAGTESDASS